jgi:hypothetical protein
VKPYYEVSEPNTMQAVIGAIISVSAFGAAYAAQLIFPVQPIAEADMLLSQTTIGTVNILNKEDLQTKEPRELIDLYLKRKANLGDIIEIVTGKTGLKESYAQLQLMDKTPEIQFLTKATEKNYDIAPPEVI